MNSKEVSFLPMLPNLTRQRELALGADSSVPFDPLKDKSYALSMLGSAIADYLAAKEQLGRSATTLEDKERYLAGFALMWPETDLSAIETRHCAHWLAAQPGGETRRVRRSHLNDFFRWAIRWELIEKNPLDRLEQPARRKKKTYDLFSDAEIAALTALPPLDGTLMLVLFDAGLRRSECVALEPRCIVPEPLPGQLRIVSGKGGKDRLVPLTKRLSRALAEYQLVEGMGARDHFWYTKPGGRKIRRTVKAGEASFHLWWVRCLDTARVRYRNPHVARHTFATRWLRRGGRLETLSLVMGHESIRTTFDLYGHLDMRDVAADLELIEAEN